VQGVEDAAAHFGVEVQKGGGGEVVEGLEDAVEGSAEK
jgi:hypothetical protein